MMGRQKVDQSQLFYLFNLEGRIPAYHILRRINPVVTRIDAQVSRANSARTAMQAAVDSVALMLSKEAASLDKTALDQKARSYFLGIVNRPEAKNINITTDYSEANRTLSMKVSATMDTALVRVIGFKNMPLSTSATIKWGSDRVRVALALDNTGSMNSAGKLDALKAATKSMLKTLKDAAKTNGDVYVSIIPFSKDVNVGAAYYNADWIDWDDWDDDNGSNTTTQTCTSSKKGKNGKATKNCVDTTNWVPAKQGIMKR